MAEMEFEFTGLRKSSHSIFRLRLHYNDHYNDNDHHNDNNNYN